jgi:hypothetical protein
MGISKSMLGEGLNLKALLLAQLAMGSLSVLTGCGTDTPPSVNVRSASSDNSDSSGTATFNRGKIPALGCSWPLVSNPDLVNIFLPDKAATYWLTAIPAAPGTRLRINGQYPDSRYFSFTAYNALLDATDGLADYSVQPLNAGTSPFQTEDAKPGAPYVVYINPDPKPKAEARKQNTLYAGDFLKLKPDGASSPVNPVLMFIYRLYVANGDTGNVPLPVITVEDEKTGEALMSLDMSICQPIPPQNTPSLLNPAIANSSMPTPLAEELASRPLPAFSAFPVFTKYYSLAETAREAASTAMKRDLPIGGFTSSVTLNVAPNPDNKYMTSFLTRDKGTMYIIRGKAPKAAIKPSDAPFGTADLRYWSMCTNEPFSQRFVGCLYDAELPVDEDGYFTLLVSDPEVRPSNVVGANKMSWLPWGGTYIDSSIVYRHMLPSTHFKQAIQDIEYGGDAAQVMGEYYPLISYCDRATIESAGSVAKTVFKACQDSRNANE